MTVDLPAELRHLVGQLDPILRARLAWGPLPERLGESTCRVCHVLLEPVQDYLDRRVGHSTEAHRAGHAALRLHDWHQAILGDSVAHEPALTRGPAAYARCLAIYRAAGWTGP